MTTALTAPSAELRVLQPPNPYLALGLAVVTAVKDLCCRDDAGHLVGDRDKVLDGPLGALCGELLAHALEHVRGGRMPEVDGYASRAALLAALAARESLGAGRPVRVE